MIRKSDGKIGLRELMAIMCITTGFKVTDMTMSILAQDGRNSSWAIPIISALVLIGPFLILLSLLKKYGDKGLIDIVYILTGKYFGFIISLWLFFVTLTGTVINSRNYINISHTMYFPRTPIIVLMVFGWLSSYFIANRGFETIGRTSWFFFTLVKGSFLLMIILSYSKANFQFLYPIAGPGIEQIVKSGINNSTILGEVFIITVLFPFIKNYEVFKKGTLIGLGFVVFELVIFCMVYVLVFDYPGVARVTYHFHELAMLVNVGAHFSSVEALFLGFWSIGATLRFAFYLYITTAIFGYMLRLKEFEPLLLPFTALVIIIELLFENPISLLLIYRGNFLHFTWFGFMVLPLLLWGLDKRKGDIRQ